MATATEVIGSLKARGVTLAPDGAGGLRVNGISRLTDREKAALKAHKGAILKVLAADSAVSAGPASPAPIEASPAVTEPLPNRTDPPEPGSTAPLGQRELDAIKAGSGCWVWSGVLNEWLFWVRDEECRTKAQERGIDPAVIWTLPELTGMQGMPPTGLRDVAAIKRWFAGTVQPGEVPARWHDALQPLEPVVAEEGAGMNSTRLRAANYHKLR